MRPTFQAIQQDGDLISSYRRWSGERDAFNSDLKKGDPVAVKAGWQKSYFRGRMPDGSEVVDDHRNKLRLKAFSIAGQE